MQAWRLSKVKPGSLYRSKRSLPMLNDYARQVGYFSPSLRGHLLQQAIQLRINAPGAGINALQLKNLSTALLDNDGLSGSEGFLGGSMSQLPPGNAPSCHSIQPVTKVPNFSPNTTRRRLCGRKKSKTMIGILLSMQSENAVESITLSCFCKASE